MSTGGKPITTKAAGTATVVGDRLCYPLVQLICPELSGQLIYG
jgi:hypothetical protein